MADARIRRQIALLAARLMYERQESEYFTAKRKAARTLGVDHRHRPKDLPSNAEIRDQVQALANLHEGEERRQNLKAMRIEALRMMRLLAVFRPRLIGSVLTGHVRQGSDIDLHVFSNNQSSVTAILDEQNYRYTVEKKRIIKHNVERFFTHIHVEDQYPIELTLYPEDKAHYVFKSSITGSAIERASTPELEKFLQHEYPDIALDAELERLDDHIDPYEIYRLLLEPLERVKQNPQWHPEGDALYHSLQVFELAREHRPWDEELILAALLHDVGKAIDPYDHVSAGLAALEGVLSPRTAFLIAHHMDAHDYREGTLGHRARQRLGQSDDFEDLMLLQECDAGGRRCGVQVCTIAQALDYLRSLEDEPYL
jgi:predicted nucleotidyltransferase